MIIITLIEIVSALLNTNRSLEKQSLLMIFSSFHHQNRLESLVLLPWHDR